MKILIKTIIRVIECFEALFRKYILKYFKTEENWIFFESEVDFSDNAYHLYDYMRKNRQGYYYIWLVNEPKKYHGYDNTIFIGKKSFRLIRNIRIWYYAHKSKYLFFTHPYWYKSINQSQVIINLWHGCAYKQMEWNFKNERIFDYIIVTSEMYRNQFADIFKFDREKILALGYPRNDFLIDQNKVNEQKKIIWMPTYRKSNSASLSKDTIQNETGLPIVNTQEELLTLNSYLKDRNIKLFLKLHHLQSENPSFKMNMSNIISLTDDSEIFKVNKLYKFVAEMDALITDYSSIAIDFLLLNKPICFTLDDYDDYEAKRGFYFENTKQLMPGSHVYDFEALKTFIDNVSQGEDAYRTMRQEVLNLVFNYQDNHSSERILNYFNL